MNWTVLDLISKTQRGCYSITLAYTPEKEPIYLARFCANPRPEPMLVKTPYYDAIDWSYNRLRGIGHGDLEKVKELCHADMLSSNEQPLN